MSRLLREMIQALAMLPFAIKVLIAVALVLDFVVITQWDRLFPKTPTAPVVQKASVSPPKPEHRIFDFSNMPPHDETDSEEIKKISIKRMAPIVIDGPAANPDGSISADGKLLYLYGIKPFNSKNICTRASGERWACGLHAYATLRNTIAHKEITCEPKASLPNGLSTICRIGTTDVAALLARKGLVEIDENTKDDPELIDAQRFAKDQRLGIWDR